MLRSHASAIVLGEINRGGCVMRYKIKWRANGDEPLSPEVWDGDALANARTRELLSKYGDSMTIEI